MKVGIKLWSTNPVEYVDGAGFADFVEVMPVDEKSLQKFIGRSYEYTTHVPHESFGFNPALDLEKSRKLLEQGILAAKKLKSEKLVMHASHFFEKSNEQAIHKAIVTTAKLAKESGFEGLLIENSTIYEHVGDHTRYYIGHSYEQIKELLELSGTGFCLDLEHVAIAANQLGISFQEHANSLLKLKPEYFHLSGARFSPTHGHHLGLFEGDVDKEFAREVLRKAKKPVCLETPIDMAQRKKEVEFMKK